MVLHDSYRLVLSIVIEKRYHARFHAQKILTMLVSGVRTPFFGEFRSLWGRQAKSTAIHGSRVFSNLGHKSAPALGPASAFSDSRARAAWQALPFVRVGGLVSDSWSLTSTPSMPSRITRLACNHPAAVSGRLPAPSLRVRSVCAARDALDITCLGAELRALPEARAGTAPSGPLPRGRGLLAELTSRAGREVEAWLGMIPAPDAAGERVAGLISLVSARSATGVRHSIGWLLVHPEARGRGVGRTLVAHACHHAAHLAAEKVWVECRSDWTAALAFWHAVGFEPGP